MEITSLQQQAVGGIRAVAPPPEPEKGRRVPPEQAARCPRCDSGNTKFCYYNNYSLSQPRHFCKDCRRFWTRGGSLRNIPVGGRGRKTKRPSLSSSPPKKIVCREHHPLAQFHAAAAAAAATRPALITAGAEPALGVDHRFPSLTVDNQLYWFSGWPAPPPPPLPPLPPPVTAAIREPSCCRSMEGDGGFFMGMGDGGVAAEAGRDYYCHGLVNGILF